MDYVIYLMFLFVLICLEDLKFGRGLYCNVIKFGFYFDVLVSNVLIDMYVKCGEVGDFLWIFDSMEIRDIVIWNMVILVCVCFGDFVIGL